MKKNICTNRWCSTLKKKLTLKNKQKIHLILSLLLTAITLAFAHNFWLTRTIHVSFDVDNKTNTEYQIYYKYRSTDKFKDESSVSKLIKAGRSHVDFFLPSKKIRYLRLNFGKNASEIILHPIKLTGKKEITLDFNDFYFNHSIKTHSIENDTLHLSVNKEDSYINCSKDLNLRGYYVIDYLMFIIIFFISFLIALKTVQCLSKFKTLEKQSLIDIIFSAVFLYTLFIPMINITDEEISPKENRKLATYPTLFKNYKINPHYGKQFEAWFNDRFFCRHNLINLQNYISDTGNPSVFKGTDGWLFFKGDNNLTNFANLTKYDEKQFEEGLKYLNDINNWCKKHNKKFYYFIAPDKHRIYGEHITTIKKVLPDEESLTNKFIEYIQKNSDIPVIYPKDALLQHKEDDLLYYKDDTHWAPYGGYIGYLELAKVISKDFDITTYKHKWEKRDTFKGDLLKMYPCRSCKKVGRETTYYALPEKKNCTDIEKKTISCTNDKGKYNAFMLRDSFTINLIPHLEQTFATSEFHWKRDITKEDLANIRDNFDIVIYENVERFIPQLFNLIFPED